jgi:aspartate/methionine/tyrosine aminotransferase
MQNVFLNPVVDGVRPSATLAMTSRVKEARRQGRPVIGLSAGEPDFDTPTPIAEAAIQAVRDGFTHYTENAGMLELRTAIADKLRADNQLDYRPEQILCSNGAKQSVAQAVMALAGQGDEVVIPAPYWVSYPEMARLSGATPVIVETTVDDGYLATPEALAASLTERTKVVILCSPSNPTGAVYSREQLGGLANVLRDHPRATLISDEIYEYITYGSQSVSFASLPGMIERTVTVNGFSKGYAMTGWRLGYLAGPLPIVKAAAKIQSQFTSAPSSISQKAGVAALAMDRGPIDRMVAAFKERRDYVLGRLDTLPGVRCPRPEGAFYVYPDISSYFGRRTPSGKEIASSTDLCFYLLDEHDVALVPGDAFGGGDGVRLSYAAAMRDLEEALDRIEQGLAALS